ncbi:hypothetical protein Pyn_40936 [Prunus yedoensis var. nudiflora]|uniref:LRR receptor-like serine/threonine-protein kinase n=1 Tax=Prunus yedoensis var. nudiflora TaxID=2094558 RepID=A0A314US00_PRUYE|nr:hypothetical protein Pyn_40936 [Prunus yedoensis var. nudiflora]
MQVLDLSYNYFSGSFPPWSSWIELPPEEFSMQSKYPTICKLLNQVWRPQMRGSGGILYEAEDSALGPATFNNQSIICGNHPYASLRYRCDPKAIRDFKSVPRFTEILWPGSSEWSLYCNIAICRNGFC